ATGFLLRPRPPRRRLRFFAGVAADPSSEATVAGSSPPSVAGVSVERVVSEGSSVLTVFAAAPAGFRLRG
ncbi:MAG: hypothetical protein M3P43_10405, partial [Actinomycetota bacterium]|nr:hypothetical protein [Actinomycetota bacterium]